MVDPDVGSAIKVRNQWITFFCPYAHKCWVWLCNKLHYQTSLPNTLMSHLQAWPCKTHTNDSFILPCYSFMGNLERTK